MSTASEPRGERLLRGHAPSTSTPGSPYWSLPPADLLRRLDSSPDGISAGAAERRLRELGPNRLRDRPRTGTVFLLMRQFTSPVVLLLIGGATVPIEDAEKVIRERYEALSGEGFRTLALRFGPCRMPRPRGARTSAA